MICCQNLFVSSVCAVYDDFPNVIGQYTGENVVDDDGSVGFKYTHNTNSDVTLELYSVSGSDRVSLIFLNLKIYIEHFANLFIDYSGKFMKILISGYSKVLL